MYVQYINVPVNYKQKTEGKSLQKTERKYINMITIL